MRNDEIDRLLGGYATNSLSDGERKVLYEAALDDQELFNALEDEEALRDLLADRESRSQIVRALKQPSPRKRLWHPWAWGLAGSLVAASAMLFVFLRPPEPQQPAPHEVAVAQAPRSQPVVPETPKKTARQTPRKAPTAVPPEQTVAAIQTNQADIPQPAPASAPSPASAMISRLREDMQPSLDITLLRRDTVLEPGDIINPGDPIQLRLRAPYSGTLTLLRPDGSESSVTVIAGQQYTFPNPPLIIDTPSTFRVTLSGPDTSIQHAELTLVPGKPR